MVKCCNSFTSLSDRRRQTKCILKVQCNGSKWENAIHFWCCSCYCCCWISVHVSLQPNDAKKRKETKIIKTELLFAVWLLCFVVVIWAIAKSIETAIFKSYKLNGVFVQFRNAHIRMEVCLKRRIEKKETRTGRKRRKKSTKKQNAFNFHVHQSAVSISVRK